MATIRVGLVISGRVQGVFYRQSALQEAQRLNLCGWVMNLPDGGVELEAEGSEESVRELVAWARRGPPAAQVDEVRERLLAPTGADRTFVVRR